LLFMIGPSPGVKRPALTSNQYCNQFAIGT
jgi:hypothetical protein